MRANVPALRRHVLELAAAGGVSVEFANARRAAAYRASPSRGLRSRIRVPEIRGQVTYFTALHELGHLLSPGNRSLRQLEAEGDAWCWAFEHALVRPTPATARRLRTKLLTYYRRAALREALGRRVRARIPPPDGLYWRAAAELDAIATAER
jgi:hypothetical protein